MALNVRLATNFNQEAFDFIRFLETRNGNPDLNIYADSRGVPTTGYGYALVVKSGNTWKVKNSVFNDFLALNVILSPTELITLSQIADALNRGDTTSARNLTATLDNSIPNIDEPQARSLFDLELDRALKGIKSQFTKYLGSEAEAELLFQSLAGSKELVALASMAYNGQTTIGPKLSKALYNNDRAEAWYEIRYNTNPAGIHASRRYKESDEFSLYNENPTEADYKSAYRTFTRHADDIQFYEGFYPPEFAGSQSIQSALEPARSWLVSNYIDLEGIPTAVDWNHIQVGETFSETLTGSASSDLLFGESGRDTLNGLGGSDVLYGGEDLDTLEGGAGDDYLIGGVGNDTLHGGLGTDTYIYNPGDGHDTIEDVDGLGRLRIGTDELTGTTKPAYQNQDEHLTTWEGELNGQKVYYQLINGNLKDGGTLEISGAALGTGSLTIQNFKNKDLGIDLSPNLVLDIKQGTEQNPIDSPDYQPQGGTGTLTERTARFFTVFLNIAAQAGDKIKLTVDNLADKLSAIVGDRIVAFAGGQVELTLEEGQTEVSFGLWDKEAVDNPETLTLAATFVPANPDPNATPATANFTLSLLDNRNPDPLDIQIGNTVEGDQGNNDVSQQFPLAA